MPRTRHLDTYPHSHFLALWERGLAEGGFLVPCNRPQALSVQGEWHAWRRAAEANPTAALAAGLPHPVRLREVALRVTPEGLKVFPADQREVALLITAALGGKPSPVGDAAQDALKRLMSLASAESTP